MKRCSKCGEIKPFNDFLKHKRNRDGLESQCRACQKASRKAKREANGDAERAKCRDYYQRNREKVLKRHKVRNAQPDTRERRRAYDEMRRMTMRDELNARSRERYAQNSEKERSMSRAYYWRHREKIAETKKRAYQINRDVYLQRSREYQVSHPEQTRAAIKRYRAAHPERIRAQKHLRRTRIAGAHGRYTDRDVGHMLAMQQGHCAYCGRIVTLTIEHINPIARGGSNGPENICLACWKCNLEKGAKTLDEWCDRWYFGLS